MAICLMCRKEIGVDETALIELVSTDIYNESDACDLLLCEDCFNEFFKKLDEMFTNKED